MKSIRSALAVLAVLTLSFLVAPRVWAQSLPIPAYPAASTPLNPSDLTVLSQSGTTKKATVANFNDYVTRQQNTWVQKQSMPSVNLTDCTGSGSHVNGDLWCAPSGFFTQVGGTVIGPLGPTGGGGGGGGSGTNLVLRTQIPSLNIGANQTILLAGYRAIGDLGAGAQYTSSGASSTGLGAIQDSAGNWFNLVISTVSNPGYFGAYGDSGSHTISSGDIAANTWWRGTYTSGETWDYVATQEAIYAAFAIRSTPGSISWNAVGANYGLNRKLYIPAVNGLSGKQYGINHQLLTVAAFVNIEFANSGACWLWQGPGTTSEWFTDSVAYGTIYNPCLSTSNVLTQPGTAAALWDMDWDGTYSVLKTSKLTVVNAVISVSGFNNAGISINAIGNNSAQGDDLIFINPEISGFAPDYCFGVTGANALGIHIIGGDMQGCTHDAIRNLSGAITVDGTTMENQETYGQFIPVQSQLTNYGGDFHSNGDFGGFSAENKISNVRSESSVGMLCDNGGGNCFIDNYQVDDGGGLGWFANYQYQVGSDAAIVSNGVNHTVLEVDDGGPSGGSSTGWLTFDNTSTATQLNDHTQAWTTNQWVGYVVALRFSNGFTAYGVISANTATSITMSSLGFTPVPGAELYHIGGRSGGSTPSWNSLPVGHFVDNAQGSIGYGASTTVGSNVIAGLSLPAVVAVNDYVVIPGADELCNSGTCIPMPLYAKVLSVGGSSITVSKNATVAVGGGISGIGVYTYAGTPFADNTIKWIDLPFPAQSGIGSCKDSYIAAGVMFNVGNISNCGGSWANWNAGPGSRPEFFGTGGTNQNQDFNPRSRYIYSIPGGFAGGTVALAASTLVASDFYAALSVSTTLTAPTGATLTAPMPFGMTRDLTMIVQTLGAGQVLTFGTGFEAGLSYTSVGAGEYVFKFLYNPYTSQWDELAGPNL